MGASPSSSPTPALAAPGRLPGDGLPDDRLRLSFLNQSRELGLAALVGLAVAARVLGAPIRVWALTLAGAWCGLAWALTLLGSAGLEPRRLRKIEVGYFLIELGVIVALARMVAAATWLALLFTLLTVLYAMMLLPPRAARGIAAAAAASFSVLVAGDFLARRTNPWPALQLRHPLAVVVLVGAVALDGSCLLGLALSQFLRMLTGQSQALQAANHDLAAASLELRLHRDHLEDIVAQRTSDLQLATVRLRTANQELQHLNQLKSNFLANVSHELRTPLTSIRSFSEILLEYPEEEVATRCEFLEIIVRETDRLTRLINDVLDLAKIEANKMRWNPQPVALGEMVRASIEVVQVVAAHRGLQLINLVAGAGPWVRADPDRLRQVLTNLLSNAIKFTPEGSIQVGVLARPAAVGPARGDVVLFVADTGIGIPEHELEHIFEKFHQHGSPLTDKPAGSGLGLSICREILEHMGGRIWAESEPQRGSVFYCALPELELNLAERTAAAAAGDS